MRKILILSIIAALVALFAFSTLFQTSEPSVGDSQSEEFAFEQNETARAESEEVSGRASLQSLLQRGESFECQIIYNPGNQTGVVEGTVFTAGERLRGDFITNSPDLGQFVSSFIVTENSVYSWAVIDGEGYGVELGRAVFDNGDSGEDLPVSVDTSVQYTCSPWRNIDNSVFVPPEDVLLRDAGPLQEAGMEYGTIYEEGEF